MLRQQRIDERTFVYGAVVGKNSSEPGTKKMDRHLAAPLQKFQFGKVRIVPKRPASERNRIKLGPVSRHSLFVPTIDVVVEQRRANAEQRQAPQRGSAINP